MVILQHDAMEKIRYHAQSEYPRECCGVILGRRSSGQRIGCKIVRGGNVAGKCRDTTHFEIDPLEIAKAELQAEEENLEIVGFYHSHPDYEAIASPADVKYMITGYSYPIISVKNGICEELKSFERIIQTNTDVKEEKILISKEK